MMTRMNALIRNEEGQGMTEYIIIVALIAIAAIGVISVFGQNLRALFATSANVLAGDQNAKIGSAGSAGKGQTTKRRNFNDFGNTKTN
jgi:Flp pilus assembly pilin Flp